MFECVRPALRLFDEVAVGDTAFGPAGREMVGVELEELATVARDTTDNDMLVVAAAFFIGVHRSPEHVNAGNRHEVSYSASVSGGDFHVRGIIGNNVFQTGFYDRF